MELSNSQRKALVYADIFDYPLTKNELERWKIVDQQTTNNLPAQADKQQTIKVETSGGYYYLKGRTKIVALRKRREKISKLKERLARKALEILKNIPTIKMIAITGGLAMRNSEARDDIDLLVISQQKTLWLTRALCTLLLEFFGLRRKPNSRDLKDKICLNMFLEDGYLTLAKNEQDLYGAHEVCQVKPLFERDNTYKRFLRANNWAREYLPNGITRVKGKGARVKQKKSLYPIPYTLYPIEALAKYFQLWYMRRRRTKEIITEHMLRFHPEDYRESVLSKYEKSF